MTISQLSARRLPLRGPTRREPSATRLVEALQQHRQCGSAHALSVARLEVRNRHARSIGVLRAGLAVGRNARGARVEHGEDELCLLGVGMSGRALDQLFPERDLILQPAPRLRARLQRVGIEAVVELALQYPEHGIVGVRTLRSDA